MEIDINTFLSGISMIVAIATAIAAHYYFKVDRQQRDEDLIKNALSHISRLRVDAALIKRERGKTGVPMKDYENQLFKLTDFLVAESELLEKSLHKILAKRIELNSDIRSCALSFMATSTSLSDDLQLISGKFQNFNNNRIGELHKLKVLLERMEQRQKP